MNNKFRRLSLQWRVTIMTVIILVSCIAVFAIFTMMIAKNSFQPVEFDSNNITATDIESSFEDGSDIVYTFVDEFSEQALLSYQHSRAIFNTTSIVLCIVIILAGSVLVYLFTEKALSPISELSSQLSSIDEENISERLDCDFGDKQIISLRESFNHVLDRLEDAFERQKLFSANASHELKTPLAVMKAGIQVLKLDEETTLEEYKENAEYIEESVNRLIKVTDNLMLLSFLGEEKPKLNENINIKNMVDSIIEELSAVYSGNFVNVVCKCDEVVFRGNTTLIYRGIYNLMENAYKYNIDNGFIEVFSGIEKIEKGRKFIFEVSNSGQIIPNDNLEFLFDAFYRLDSSRSRKKEGAGLGLSIVKSIVDYHKGEIYLEALELGGLKIRVELPVN